MGAGVELDGGEVDDGSDDVDEVGDDVGDALHVA